MTRNDGGDEVQQYIVTVMPRSGEPMSQTVPASYETTVVAISRHYSGVYLISVAARNSFGRGISANTSYPIRPLPASETLPPTISQKETVNSIQIISLTFSVVAFLGLVAVISGYVIRRCRKSCRAADWSHSSAL